MTASHLKKFRFFSDKYFASFQTLTTKKMSQLRNDFNIFKEQQREMNQSFIERLKTLEIQNQKSTIKSSENTESIPIIVQIRNILEKLISFDDRIKRIEELDPFDNRVNIFFKSEISNRFKNFTIAITLTII